MSVHPAEPAALARVAARYGLRLSRAELASFEPLVKDMLSSWDLVEELHAETGEPAPQRTWARPEHNPLGAWYVTCEVNETDTGPLAGRTVAVKDNVAVAGVPMMNGSALVDGFIPDRDATVVSRLLAAGATVAGKAVCEDLCFSGASHTAATGPVRNPWDTERTTGGSSSGSAALVASGAVDLAIGGDQGGSVRLPAAFTGIVGHKPTHGLVPYTGAFPIEQTLDHLGPMTRTVTDAARVLTVVAGADRQDPRQPAELRVPNFVEELDRSVVGLRVGVVREGFGHPESVAGVDDAVRTAVDTLRAEGLVCTDISIPWHLHGKKIWDVIAVEGGAAQMVDGNAYGMNWQGRYDPRLIEYYGTRWRQNGALFPDTVKLVLLAGGHTIERHHGTHYAMARNLVPRLRGAYDAALTHCDVLVMPTTPILASRIPDPDAPLDEYMARALEMMANTATFDVTGHPAASVPAGTVDGLPTGMMIVGRHFDDASVLRVARAFERAVGGFPVPPRAAS
ncbi:amidase [Mycolicibacterium vaccae]|uniref:Amidase n=1 Tax=Mycolicibacterium vaccae ATCC 25954 TaxID=1194972 RepID=K0UHE4_MYCVA|nr:amidase [Mycolicibacterium vaccae]ANI41546.1 amidase [Mycolicibacterium vaccae 95051]EJZ06672.1 amidase [Mycolicibacterium vaccae ATCC 25954]